MTRITRVEVIDENGRSYVNWKEDNDITLSYQDDGRTLKVFVNKVKPKTGEEGALEAIDRWLGEEPPEEQKLSPIEQTKKDIENLQNKLKLLEYQETVRTDVEKAYRDFYGHYPIIDMSTNDFDCVTWVAFKEGYKAGRKPKEYQPTSEKSENEQQMKELIRESVKWCEEHPDESVEDYLKPHTPEKTEKSLRTAFVKAQQTEEWKETQRKIDGKNPPEFLKFELRQNLTDLIYDWWEDVFAKNSNDDMENCIGRLVYWIEEWLPKEQSAAGSQNAYVECSVEGFNDCINKIRRKLR